MRNFLAIIFLICLNGPIVLGYTPYSGLRLSINNKFMKEISSVMGTKAIERLQNVSIGSIIVYDCRYAYCHWNMACCLQFNLN